MSRNCRLSGALQCLAEARALCGPIRSLCEALRLSNTLEGCLTAARICTQCVQRYDRSECEALQVLPDSYKGCPTYMYKCFQPNMCFQPHTWCLPRYAAGQTFMVH